MNTFASYRLYITPLSPIHIGTGESYEPTNYVIDDGVLHEFDTGAVMEAFSAKDREDLLNLANRKPNEDMIKGLQRFFHDRRDALKPWAVNAIPVLPGVADLYATRVGQTANREADGRQVLNRLEIDRTGHNPITRKPVLFGSSLKGSVRTALLNQVNGGYRAPERKGLHEFQGRLFRYRDSERGRLHLELDPLRLIQFADASWQNGADLPATHVHLAVNRKKMPVMDRQGQPRRAMGENLYQILECVPGWYYRAFSLQVNVQLLNGIRDKRDVPDPQMRFSMQTIASACNAFYLPILTAERKIMQERGFSDPAWEASVKRCLQLAKDKLASGQAFLLRAGRHSGAESVTVSGARNGNIRIMRGKGQQPEFADAPKTLWLAASEKDQDRNLLPFGWLLVEVQPVNAPEQDWPELKDLCEPHLNTAREFAAKRQGQAEAMAQVRAEAESKRREEEEKARRKAEEDARIAREEEERQARLAAMSPELQAVEAFRTYYLEQKAKGRYQPGSLFDEKRRAIVTAALLWRDADARKILAALVRQAVKEWTDWPNKKERKVELRGWLEQLETTDG
jgi:CRISPR-associated protein Csm5